MDWKYLFLSLEGRINRAKFWAGIGVIFVGAIIATIIDNVAGLTIGGQPYGVVYIIYVIAMIWPAIMLYAKRWHDRDKSGWWTLIAFVPVIGGIWILIELGILAGKPGENRFGPDPLGRTAAI
ncbi:MAG: DUF805 domain-containing protein [Salaquimonas sp.]|jgi:uncharacterized membrane protein YhaH (DUF805 family)|nr:DUF805 domain-containing protein [Salaquimonas sp.]